MGESSSESQNCVECRGWTLAVIYAEIIAEDLRKGSTVSKSHAFA